MIQYKKIYIKAFLIAIMLLSVFSAKAQTGTVRPGNTGHTVELWLKADELNNAAVYPSHDTDVTTWLDRSSNGLNFATTSTVFPRINYNGLNYNPGVRKLDGTTYRTTKMTLEGGKTFPRSRSNAYYIFYVSRKSTEKATTSTVISFGNDDYVGWGGTAAPRLFGETDGGTATAAATIHPGIGKSEGIGTYIIPNIYTDSYPKHLYHNGNRFITTRGQTSTAVSNPSLFTSVTGSTGYTAYFEGDIYEIIVLSSSAGSYINNMDLNKIHSYLAIKYGQSLDASMQPNLYNGDGKIVWDASKNGGYSNHVFGLGKDSKTGLNQKQSANSDNSKFVVYVGSSLAQTNVHNTTQIQDGTYVLFGSNAAEGMANYVVPAGTNFANGVSFTTDITYRYNEAFRVQISGGTAEAPVTSQTVNFNLPKKVKVLFVSSKNSFPANETRAYTPDANGNYIGIELKDGEFISYGPLMTPASVSYTTELWLRAEDIGLANGSAVGTWTAHVGDNFNQTTTASRPLYNTASNLMNFRPSVNFSLAAHRLPSASNVILSADKSYYTFSVSQLRTPASGTAQTVLYSLNGVNNNYDMWTGGIPSFMTNGTSYNYPQKDGKKFGIMGVIRPNNTIDEQMIFVNGNWLEKDPAILNMPSSGTRNASIGGSTASTNPFIGNVQEMIILSTNSKGQIDLMEALKINSYLAVKYGITLQLGDYVTTNGTAIWSRSEAVDARGNTYDKSIFGIGHAVMGHGTGIALNQKQARAYDGDNQSPFAIYLGSLADLNDANTHAGWAEGTFLMLGANASIRSIRPLETAIPIGSTFKPGSDVNTVELNYSSAIYKAQVTTTNASKILTVNIKSMIPYPDSYMAISKDPDFAPDQTLLRKFDLSGVMPDVQIEDGDYIAILTNADSAPAGIVDNLRLWLRADVPTSITKIGDDVDSWTDVSSNGVVYSYMNQGNGNQRPSHTLCSERLNYHPAVKFDSYINGTDYHLEYLSSNNGVMSVASPEEYSFFTVFYNRFTNPVTQDGTTYIWASYYLGFGALNPGTGTGIDEARRPTFGSAKIRIGASGTPTGSGRYYEPGAGSTTANGRNGVQDLFRPTSTAVALIEVHKGEKVRFEFDGYGEDISTYASTIGVQATMNGASMLGIGSRRERFLDGEMGEIFAYERALAQDEKNSIYSSLGLKYGITLDLDQTSRFINFDYFLSNGKIIWPGNSPSHQMYHHNVAAIVRDDAAGLNNMQSHSTGDGAIVQMSIGDGIGCNAVLTGLKDDKTAIAWGHDNAYTIDEDGNTSEMLLFDPDDENVCGEMQQRYARTWLAYMTDVDEQEVTISASGIGFVYGFSVNDVYMLVASDPNMIANNEWEEVIKLDFIDGKHQAKYTLKDQYTYFTFGIKENPGACDACEYTTSKTIEFKNNSTWNRGDMQRNYNLGDSFDASVKVTLSDSRARMVRRYPRASTGNSLRLTRYRYLHTPMTVEIAFKDNLTGNPIAAAAEFDIFEIDYLSGRYDDIVIWGECTDGTNTSRVKPKLSYHDTAARSTYTISKTKALPNGLTGMGAGARAKRRPTSGYTTKRGKMHVEFDYPVQKVLIHHEAIGRPTVNSGYKRIGLSPITTTCPKPLPKPNQDGLVFVKTAASPVYTCQQVIFTYRIININCAHMPVDFTEVLPDKMKWVENSITVDNELSLENAVVTYSNDGKTIEIKDLVALRGSQVTTLRITAAFDMDAPGGFYSTEAARLNYTIIKEGVGLPSMLRGTDILSGNFITTIEALESPERPLPIKIVSTTATEACYVADDEITFSIIFENPNNKVASDVEMDLFFNEEFTLKSFTAPTLTNVVNLTDNDPDADPGYRLYGFNIPAGTHIVTVVLTAPNAANLVPDVIVNEDGTTQPALDSNGNPLYVQLGLDFSMSSDATDVCDEAMFDEAEGGYAIDYCSSKNAIISNEHITGKPSKIGL